jgi:AcrR family transcriptional regulator
VALISEGNIAVPTAESNDGSSGENGADRTRQIVAAAYELLDEAGLEGLTIRAVLHRTGLSRRAFYERFVGKDDLVVAVFEETIRLAVDHFSEQVKALADPMDRLKLIVTNIVLGRGALQGGEFAASNRRGVALTREHLRLAESRPEALQAAVRPLVALIARHLADGMRTGSVRDYDPHRLAALVYNLVSTTVHMELLAQETARPDPRRRDRLASEIWEFCRRAIVA